MQRSALCRYLRELSNEYSLAKIGFDTAENKPDFRLIKRTHPGISFCPMYPIPQERYARELAAYVPPPPPPADAASPDADGDVPIASLTRAAFSAETAVSVFFE